MLESKVIVVSGAGKGIGKACMDFFLAHGAHVVGLTRGQADINALKAEHAGKPCEFVLGDVTSRDDLQATAKLAIDRFGRVDGLVNNAGMRQRKDFLELTPEDWDAVIRNNLTSCFASMQVFLPYMVSQGGGSIVNIASIVGERGFAQLGGYAASKSGMIGLTRSVAAEFAKDNVRVNAICPGFAETSYTESFKSNRPALYQTTLDRTPMGRWGSAEEIAHSIAYLLSDLSTYVTGSVMAVDGGWMAT